MRMWLLHPHHASAAVRGLLYSNSLCQIYAYSKFLIQSNRDITPHSSSEMNFSFKIKLNTNQQCCTLHLSILINGTFQQLTYQRISKTSSKNRNFTLPAGARRLSEVGIPGCAPGKLVANAFRPLLSSLGE